MDKIGGRAHTRPLDASIVDMTHSFPSTVMVISRDETEAKLSPCREMAYYARMILCVAYCNLNWG